MRNNFDDVLQLSFDHHDSTRCAYAVPDQILRAIRRREARALRKIANRYINLRRNATIRRADSR